MVRVESASGDSTGQCGPCIGLRVAVGEAPFLGEEFRRDDAPFTGLEGEVFGTRRGAFPMDALAHRVDGGLPVGLPGGEVRLWEVETAKGGGKHHETGGGGGVTRNGACTEQGLDFPESCAALVILRMRGDGVDKQSLVAVWAQSASFLRAAEHADFVRLITFIRGAISRMIPTGSETYTHHSFRMS